MTGASIELEHAHRRAVGAAMAGLQDAQLGPLRVSGQQAYALADAAVTSATPYLRAPILGRLSAVLLLHPPGGPPGAICATCATPVPCQTAQALSW